MFVFVVVNTGLYLQCVTPYRCLTMQYGLFSELSIPPQFFRLDLQYRAKHLYFSRCYEGRISMGIIRSAAL